MRLGALIFLSYMIIAVNTRAIAKGAYLAAAVSCSGFMAINFMLIRFIVEARSWHEFGWYLFGGVAGDLAGIYVSKHLDKQKDSSI